MHTERVPERSETNAVVLLWQTRFRLLLIIAVGGTTLVLNWAGKLETDSVLAWRYGADAVLNATAVLSLLYFGFVGLLALRMQRTHSIGTWAVAATFAADMIAFNGTVLLTARPEWYERALILSLFSLQLTLLYFGWRHAILNLMFAVAGYLGSLLIAEWLGGDVQMNEALWTGGVFTLAMTAFAMLHADLSARLAMIVRLFDRTREGVFSLTFDEDSGQVPDGVTVVGESYERMREQLRSLILTDPLTHCFNPRGFEQMSLREVARSARAHSVLTLLALDLDHFKDINDTYGHIVGDQVLRDIGAALSKTARLSDVVARIGGEEFAILAPDTDEAGAAMFAQRVLDACRALRFPPLADRHVTVSVGVATVSARTPDVIALLRSRADEALYAAKHAGRNRAEVWHEKKP